MKKILTIEDEREKLKEVLKIAEKELKEEEMIFHNLEKHTTDEFILYELQKKTYTKINNLKKALLVPYFARVDFKEEKDEKEQDIYIGKTNILDENYNVVVADWRAPISSVYYDGEIGKTSYETPDGIIEGELLLKRQYIIEDANLIRFSDIDITTNDELLQECLKQNSDSRLKNIVATIQKEQNKIIRSNMFKPLIVQGVAGSGKTTVAIHRIAYLIYTYEEKFRPEEFLIIAPNKFFLDYIKNSLPDLGVDYVRQETFEEFALKIIKDKIKIEDTNVNLIKLVENDLDDKEKQKIIESSKYKGSLKFKEVIDKYLKEVNLNILEKNDFYISGIKVFSYNNLLNVLMDNYERFSLKTRIENLERYMKYQLENKSSIIIDQITELRKKKIEAIDKSLSQEEQNKKRIEIFERYEDNIKSLIKDNGSKIIKEYIKKIKIPSAINSYKEIINNEISLDYIKEEFNEKMKKKTIQIEDLTPILYIQYELYGMNEKLRLKHIVIDEAQDFSEFQFYILNKILSNNKSLTILGDIAQGIYDYKGINDWKKVNEDIFNNEANIEYLTQSYRTTSEIMEEANKVISPIKDKLKIVLAEAISRYGEKVEHYKCENYKEKIERIVDRIKSEKDKGYVNIAIIGKNNQTCEKVYKEIKEKINNVNLITKNTVDYNGGITIVPSYYSKGLEFDSVILLDYDNYTQTDLDRKLLYVSLTRAMHSLLIIH